MDHHATHDAGHAPQREFLLTLVIVAATLLVYSPAIRGGFFWDDAQYLCLDKLIKAPDGLRRFWFTTQASDYFPLTWSVLWGEWRIWGIRPAGYHVVNVLLHAVSAVLVWRVLRRLRVPGAWLAGALFAVHPVAVDSAAWISECKNTLSMALYLMALLAYLTYDEREKRGWYLAAAGVFLLALLAKTSVVMLPAVLLLCAWWRRGKISLTDLARSLPFFALALVLGLVTIWFQLHNAIHGNVHPEGAASRLAASGWIIWFYLHKLLLPMGLCAIYPRWKVDGASVTAFLPLALLAAGLILLWMRRKSFGRAPLFAATYFVIALLPVLGGVNMLFMGLSLVADHFQYLAMIGVIAFAAAVLARAASARGWAGRAGVAASVGCVVVLGVLTWNRAGMYGDEELLWQDNLAKNPSVMVWNAQGNARSYAGRYDLALADYDHALALDPGRAEAWYNRGITYAALHRLDFAIGDYDRAIQLNPDFVEAHYYRGCANLLTKHFADAIRDYGAVIALDPNFVEAYDNRAIAWSLTGQADEAEQDWTQAIALEPDYADAYCNRARFYSDRKEYTKALADIRMFEKLGGHPKPDFVNSLSKAAGRAQ